LERVLRICCTPAKGYIVRLISTTVEEILVASALFVAAGTTGSTTTIMRCPRLGGLPRHALMGRTNSLQRGDVGWLRALDVRLIFDAVRHPLRER
jgi:hypothetical protein